MTDNYIRPFSVAWYANMHKQGQNISEDSLTGFPELVATAGLEDHDETKAYLATRLHTSLARCFVQIVTFLQTLRLLKVTMT